MVVLFVHVSPHRKGSQRIRRSQQMESQRRDRSINHDLPEIADIQIDRIRQKQELRRLAVGIYRIEDRGQPHQQLGQDPPQVLHVPEEHEQCRQNQPHSQIEHDHADYRIDQQQEFPGERNPIKGRKRKKDQQGQPEVDERRHILGKQKQILGNIHLGKDPCVPYQRGHPQIGGICEIRKHQLSGEQIDHIMVDIVAKQVAEHQPHNQQVHQRGQDAPRHPQDRPLIFFCEIPLHQLSE